MYAIVRNYSGAGAKQLFDVLEKQKAEVEANLRKVTGLVSYTLVRSGDGGMSITVCNDKAGADESVKVAREWIKKNAANVPAFGPGMFFEPVRTMTATIAAEMGEVAKGSQHYSVLFEIGIVLFLITFAINSLAGRLVGQPNRRRRGQGL